MYVSGRLRSTELTSSFYKQDFKVFIMFYVYRDEPHLLSFNSMLAL